MDDLLSFNKKLEKDLKRQTNNLNRVLTPSSLNKKRTSRDIKRSFGVTLKHKIYDTQNGKCAKCGKKVNVSHMEYHHKIHWANGGQTVSKNGVGLCHDCHKDIHDDERIKKSEQRVKDQRISNPFSPW